MPRGAKPFFTADQDQEVIRRYAAGETLRAIGASYGVSMVPVQAVLKRHGIERRQLADYRWKPTPENRAELVRLWRSGLGVQTIARTVGTSNDNVSRYLRKEGIQPRLGARRRRFNGDEVTALIAEYAETGSLAELGRRHGCSHVLIRNTLKRAGVKITYNGHEPKFWTEERIQWLREQHLAGRALADIGHEVGYAPSAIGRKLLDLGIRSAELQPKRDWSPAWKGGRTVDSNGYVRVLVADDERHLVGRTISGGYVLEHRLVMARQLGRPLLKTETVHHVNGNKQDNSPENLQLRQGNHGKGVFLRCADCGSHNVEAAPLT